MSEPAGTGEAPPDREGGRYRIEALLGHGGMGAVYRAFDLAQQRRVAFKALPSSSVGAIADAALRFQREFHTLKQLRHPRIVEVYDYGVDDHGCYYTMELLDGLDLRALAPLEWRRACRLLRDVASALALLHSRRLLHRDVSARNVRCTGDDRAKLMDFGVIATMGVSREVVGTTPYIPPESVYGQPLDQRADLFSLGALAYWLLTGRHAYPANRIEALTTVWRALPALPSSLASGIPTALDELVLSLLSMEPLARPRVAGEVIDRLSAIAQLDATQEPEVNQAYLVDPPLIGRAQLVDDARQYLGRAALGHGDCVLIEATRGLGRSRLLQEIVLHAKVAGAIVLHAAPPATGSVPYGVARTLAEQLIEAAATDALEAAQGLLPALSDVVPMPRARVPVEASPTPASATVRRAQVIASLKEWLLRVSQERFVLIAVDDLHRCDEASAALIAAVASAAGMHRLLVVATAPSEEPFGPVAVLWRQAQRMVLHGLGASETQALVQSLFGDVPNVTRLAGWMHDVVRGNPLQCIELARHLVDRGIVRHAQGTWILPTAKPGPELPDSLLRLFDERTAWLVGDARFLAEVVSLVGGPVSLEQCVLWTDWEHSRIFRALNELVHADVLIGTSGDRYHLRHEGVREALWRSLSDERRRLLHDQIGTALAAHHGGTVRSMIEAAIHLLRGGTNRLLGAQLMARALESSNAFLDELGPEGVAALESALEVYESEGRPPGECLRIRTALVECAYLHDHRLLRYADGAIQQLRRDCGLAFATELDDATSDLERLHRGIATAAARYESLPPDERGLEVSEALRRLVTCAFWVVAVAAVSCDCARIAQMAAVMQPFAALGPTNPAALAYSMILAILDQSRGRDLRARARLLEALEHLGNPEVLAGFPGNLGHHLRAAHLHAIGLMEAAEGDSLAMQRASELEALGAHHEVAATQIRLIVELFNGSETRVRELTKQVELLAIQAGSSWRIEKWFAGYTCAAASLCGDLTGLSRAVEQLTTFADELPGFAPFRELARAAYHRERGEIDEAQAILERAMPVASLGEHVAAPLLTSVYVETLVLAGAYERASGVARAAMLRCEELGVGEVRGGRWLLTTGLAIAQARLGNCRAAAELLDPVIDRVTHDSAPGLFSCVLLEARARVALIAGDMESFRLYATRTAKDVRSVGNPALLARYERLADSARRSLASVEDEGAPMTEEQVTTPDSPRRS